MALNHFTSDGVDIAWLDSGEGEPILLIHGFASNHVVNWGATGWIDRLKRAGRRVIAMDVRGHGQSGKPGRPEAYRLARLANDAANLLDHLKIDRADVLGYSMGARIGAMLAVEYPGRVRSLIIGGLGMALIEGMNNEDEIIAALEAPGLDAVVGDTGRAYRKFAEQTGSDLAALAACMRSVRENLAPEQLALIDIPVLIAVGENDEVAGSAEALAAFIPGAEVLTIPKRDHMLATADRVFVAAALDFLDRRP